jgi:adenylate cyclase
MAQQRVTRKLAAILSADVAGYSRLMGEDEAATLDALVACRSIIDQIIAEHDGRVFGSAGDSVVAEFPSAVEAVICAREFQERIADRNAQGGAFPAMQFRVGINLGDVIIEGDNLYGDGVNIAARLEAVAEPGGICVSSKVYEEVKRKIDIGFTDGGVQALKNIEDPIAVYHVGGAQALRAAEKEKAPKRSGSAGKLLTVAVHELKTIGGGDEAAELAEGLIEDIRDGLGRQTALAVTVGGEGTGEADFVLEGSVRDSGKRLRLSFALLEGANRRQVWSERYDRTLDDVFELQDEISRNVASTIRVRVKAQIFERLAETENDELAVPELLDKAAGYMVRGYGNNTEAEAALRLALERAPENSMAKSMLAGCLHRQGEFSAAALPEETRDEIMALTREAVALAPESYFARLILAVAHYDLAGDFEAALGEARTALESYPGLTPAQAIEGIARIHLGAVEEGLDLLGRAIEANKIDPNRFRHYREQAIGHYVAGRLDQAIEIAGRLVEQTPGLARNRLVLAVLLQLAGATGKARAQFAELGELATVRPTRIGNRDAAERFETALAQLRAAK